VFELDDVIYLEKIMQELITLVSVIVAGISGIAGILWSK